MVDFYPESYIGNKFGGYRDKIENKYTKQILNGRKSISAEELKKTPIFSKIYNNLDSQEQKIFDKIASLDKNGADGEYSLQELNTLIAILDGKREKITDGHVISGTKDFYYDADNLSGGAGSKIGDLSASADDSNSLFSKLYNIYDKFNQDR